MREKIHAPTRKEFFAKYSYPFVLYPIVSEYLALNHAVHIEDMRTISEMPYRTWLRKVRSAKKEGRGGVLFLSHEGRRLFSQSFNTQLKQAVKRY